MKKFIPTLFFLLGLGLHAQVGVGTTNPQSTLDIEASNATNPTNTDGILVPRIDNFSISNPTATQDGMLVFYTGSGASGKGFYYWDNSTTTWIYLSSGSKNTLDQAYDEGGAGAGRTITADTGAVIIEGGGGLRVESSAQTSMLNVNGANNAVGIGEGNPTSPLHVGVSTTFDLLRPNSGQDGIFIKGGDDNSGLDAIGASISFGGAATTRANGRKSAIALVQTSSFVDQNGLAFYVHPSNANSDPMSEGMRLTHQKYLGINNTSPSATLDVVGTMQFVDGNEATGYVLSSDASGNASWTNPASIFTDTDDQNIQNLSFNNSTSILTVGIENGTAQTVNLSTLNTGGDITQITAGSGMTGGGTTGAITLNAYGTNGLLTYADDIRLGGTLTQNTQIALAAQTFDINLNSTGDFAIQDAGTDVFFVENTGDIGIGNSNPAYPLHITESVNGTTRGLFIDKTDNSGNETSGLYIEKTGNGSGRSHAIFTDIDGTGDGQKYGVFNRITSSANGSQYGTRNFLNGATSSSQFATFNNLDNNATGNQYGVYNGMRGINASNLYGVFNEFSYSFSGVNEITGIKNQFSGGNPGTTEGSTGIFSTFSTPANGTYYGVRNVFSAGATGTGTKYGTYNIIDNSAGGTHYGTYNNVATSNGWAGYFLGKAYVSNKLGVGTGAGDPDGFVEVRANNSGAQPNINLVDIGDSGARINFSNTDTTNGNVWTLFGDTENTAANSRFNIYHPTGGNIIQIMGDGLVGINRAPTTNSLEVSGNASKNTAGGWLANSDRRLKKNINTIDSEYALNKLLALRGVTYEWDDDKTGINRPEELQYGFIAQELMEVFPEKVTKDNLGFYQTAYGDYDAVFVQAIKALNTKIETLETENKILKEKLSKLEVLEARILALENNNTINSTKNETASAIKD